jgi:hypothetical protein
VVIAGHRQHVADASDLQLGSQPGVGAVDLVASHPRCRDTGVQRAGEHPGRQRRLGGKPDPAGDTGGLQAARVAGPGPGQIQLPVDHRVPGVTGVYQVDRDLSVVDAARGAGVLALHPHRSGPFFRSPVSSMTSTAPGSPR